MVRNGRWWQGTAGMRWLLGAALTAPLLFGPRSLSAQEGRPIIDMHMHTYMPPDDHVAAGAPSLCRPEPCEGTGSAAATPAENLRRTLAAMERHNVVLGFLSGPDIGLVQEWVAEAPERFVPSVFLLAPGQPDVETLRREYRAGRLSGLGEIGTQLNGIAPNDPELEPYFALAEELDIPVLIHAAGIGPYLPGFRSTAGDPRLLEDVLVRHPDLRIYVENAGYPHLDEMIAMMYQYPQLHADLSTITWVVPRPAFHAYLEGLVRAGLGKRLMFGSDQMRWPESIGWGIEAIEAAAFLTSDQKRDILHDNAARFLRLGARADAVGEDSNGG